MENWQRKRKYWVVSPNVKNDNRTVGKWRQASVTTHAAFMGWGPNDPKHGQMGPKFAGKGARGIDPGDVILIARRSRGAPEVVGFGVVEGEAKTTLSRFQPPDDEFSGSVRALRPFVPWSKPPTDVPFAAAVTHTKALAQLHPDSNDAHQQICEWMERHLKKSPASAKRRANLKIIRSNRRRRTQSNKPALRDIAIVSLPGHYQLDYEVQTKAQVRRAQGLEARLLGDYKTWLKNQDRQLDTVKYGALRCDGYERLRGNLIEAKSSASREHIRMAVGQLLDYAFQGKTKLGEVQMAVLLPEKPPKDVEAWLDSVDVRLIWSEGPAFLDNSNGQFT